MSMKLYSDNSVSAIASKIRTNLGASTTYKIGEMATGVQTAIDKYKNNCPSSTSTTGTCTNALDVPMKNYDVYGNSTQDTTTGTQLFDISAVPNTSYITNNGDYLTVTGTTAASTGKTLSELAPNLEEGETYIISADAAYNAYIYLLNIGTWVYGATRTITNADLQATVYFYGSGSSTPNDIKNIRINKGTTASNWEPYTGGIASPNPSYPQEISSVGDLVTSGEYAGKYKVPVYVDGKNLAKYETQIKTRYGTDLSHYGVTYTSTSQKYTINGTTTGTNTFIFGTISLLKSGTYKFAVNNVSGTISNYIYVVVRDSNDNLIKQVDFNGTSTSDTFTISENKENLKVNIYVPIGLIFTNSEFQIQIQDNNITDTTYEPYYAQTETDMYLDEPLRGIGSVRDYIDFATQKRHNLIGSKENLITAIINVGSYIGGYTTTSYWSNKKQVQNTGSMCNKAIYSTSIKTPGYYYENPSNFVFIGTADDTLATLKQKYDGAEVLYVLATETTEDVTLPQLNLHEGTNIITIGTTVQPSQVSYVYITKVS